MEKRRNRESNSDNDSQEDKPDSGDAVEQLVSAKRYLQRADVEPSSGDLAKCAVNLLVKSSRQGNEEATELLKNCLQRQLGIDESNLEDVHWCISTPLYERRALAAARNIFRSMQLFSDAPVGGAISKVDYEQKLEELAKNKLEKKILQKLGKVEEGKAELGITEEMFVNKMLRRLHGQGGLTLTSLLQNDVEWEAYNAAGFLEKLTKYPGKTLAWVADQTIEIAGGQGRLWLRSLVPVNQLYMFLILFIYSLISLEVILWTLPLLAFYASYAAMIISTMQMFYARRKLNDVLALAELLERFNEQFKKESAESAFTWSTLSPYITFFVSLPAMILSFSVVDKMWIPRPELTMLSLTITVACFLALSDRYDYLAILSVLLDTISTLPPIVAGLPHIPVLYSVLQVTIGAGISLELLPQFYVQFGLPSIAYLIVPALFLRMAMQRSWHGTYQILVPHLVCFFWWRVVVTFYLSSSWLGLLRATLGWALFALLMPVLIAGFTIYIGYLAIRAVSIANFLKVTTTMTLLAGVAAFAVWSRNGFRIGGRFNLDNPKSIKSNILLSIILVVSAVPLVYIIAPEDLERKSVYLPWEIYRDNCHTSDAENAESAVDVAIGCAHFADAKVNWTGTVRQTVIKHTENQAQAFFDYLPWFASNTLQSVYGESYPEDCDTVAHPMSKRERDVCEFNKLRGRKYHLKKLNRYTFEMSIAVESEYHVRLKASHYFKDFITKIKAGDLVTFRAYLGNDVEISSSNGPVLYLYALKCESCADSQVVYGGSVLGQTSWGVFLQIKHALQSVWNFFLAPILVFKYN